jgi:hypothetical protein
MTAVRERYRPQNLAADATYYVTGSNLGGFIPVADGTLSVASTDNQGAPVTLVEEVPVTAGAYLPLPFASPFNQPMTVILAGGAAGTLLI